VITASDMSIHDGIMSDSSKVRDCFVGQYLHLVQTEWHYVGLVQLYVETARSQAFVKSVVILWVS
jgi:hypothetical protein